MSNDIATLVKLLKEPFNLALEEEKVQKPTVIIEKDYPTRRLIAGILSLPMLFLFSTLLVVPVMLVNPALAVHIPIALPLTLVAELLTILWAVKYAWPKGEWKEALSLRKPQLKHVLIGLGVGVALIVLLQLLGSGFAAMGLEIQSSNTSTSLASLTGFERVLVFFILSPLIVPVVEELFFRGFIMNAFRGARLPSKSRTAVAVIVSSLLFAAVHMQGFSTFTDVFLPLWIFIVALSSAFLAIRFNSIWVAVASHIAYNSATVILSVIAGSV